MVAAYRVLFPYTETEVSGKLMAIRGVGFSTHATAFDRDTFLRSMEQAFGQVCPKMRRGPIFSFTSNFPNFESKSIIHF